jgi:hypothetical protein
MIPAVVDDKIILNIKRISEIRREKEKTHPEMRLYIS